jgi:Phage tail lysozyme
MAGGVTAEQIYETLLANGYSSAQAFGIMGNMICESSLDPEAVNPGGPTAGVGLVQWQTTDYPGAAGLVTGNPVQDMDNQIRFLAQHAVSAPGSVAASGSTGAEVAANWAVNFEKCAACSPTGSYGLPPSSPGGYDDRVANAGTVEGWASSGNWPDGSAPAGSWLCAFQDNKNQLWLCNSNRQNNETGIQMAPGTSPSLVAQPDGSWLCALQDNKNQLWLCNSNRQNNETGIQMAPGTSPSLVSQGTTAWLCALQDNKNQLWLCNSNRQNNETGLGMGSGAPSLQST